MSENFSVNESEVEILLKDAKKDVIMLLEKLDIALEQVSNHLLEDENITQEECKEILRDIF
jgi:ATP-dependent Zn protease